MAFGSSKVVVAGHVCLDILPAFESRHGGPELLSSPGALVEVGPAVLSTGGAVSNTGLALHRLGIPTRLMGKLGDDLFGRAVREIIDRQGPGLSRDMLVEPGADTSYSVVISPPGVDRIFLHCPGANDTFAADDVPYDSIAEGTLFHFGYPPLMRRMYADGGDELAVMLRKVRQRGAAASLDMARPDPAAESGRVDWAALLARALPEVELFLPSIDEILFMLDRPRYDRLSGGGDLASRVDRALLHDVSGRLLDLGAALVLLKLGHRGLYVRITPQARRLAPLERVAGRSLGAWAGRELHAPCFEVQVRGTTGCGDRTIAGFLAGLCRGQTLDEAVTSAVAVGACSVEAGGGEVPAWEAVQTRIASGWPRRTTVL